MRNQKRTELLVCSTVELHLDDYLECELEPGTREEFEIHFNQCSKCKDLLSDIVRMKEAASSLVECPIPRDVSLRLREKLNRVIKADELGLRVVK